MKLRKLNLGRILGLMGLGVLLAGLAMAPTRAQQGSLTGARPYALPGSWLSYSPDQLGADAITLPLNGTTADTNIIDTRGVKEATVFWICNFSTTGTVGLNVLLYDEDGATVFGEYTGLVSAIGTAQPIFVYFGSESNYTAQAGTLASTSMRLPQRALAFSWTESGGSTGGTCTARLFLQY
jgi:hypothetical protein